MLAPGDNVVVEQVMGETVPVPEKSPSVTAMPVTVTLPALVTWNVYVTTCPTAITVLGAADFESVNAAVCVTGNVTDDGGDTGAVTPTGGVPVAVAVLATEPA